MTGIWPAEQLIVVALLAPLLGATLIPLFRYLPNMREAVTFTAAGLLLLAVLGLLPTVLAGGRPEWTLAEVAPGLALAFTVEPLGMLFALIASSLWIVTTLYSIGYMRTNAEEHQTGFYACFAIALGATIGIAFAKNLFTLFLFYEALTISTYPLVAHKRDLEARKAGRLYLLLLLGTSMLLFLPAIIGTYAFAGTIEFKPGGVFGEQIGGATITVITLLFLFGIGKAAVMPLHAWLPAAMVAPTPVSALLHAVAVVKAGVFSILKIALMIVGIERLAGLGASWWLTAIAGTTVLVASLVALYQDNLKRRLAYSTISQLSYVVLGVAILTPLSTMGAAMHIAGHAAAKITLFFAAGAIYTAAHLTKVSQLDGIGRRMPWTMTAFTVGAFAMIGLPPTAGFLGKWLMLGGAMQSANWLAVGVIVASTLLNAGYFLPIVYRAFCCEPPAADHPHGEAPWPMVAALATTGGATVALFLDPDLPFALATMLIGR